MSDERADQRDVFRVYVHGRYAGTLGAVAQQPVVLGEPPETDDAAPCLDDLGPDATIPEPVCCCDAKELALGNGHDRGCPHYREQA